MESSQLEVREHETPVLAPKAPVVWRGIGSQWTCTRNWTLPGLAERFSGRKIRVRATDNEIDAFFERNADASPFDQFMLFDEYIEAITRMPRGSSARPAYAGNISIRNDPVSAEWAGKLLDECPISSWLPGLQFDEYRLWIGAAGQKSSVHSDPYDNLNAQIIGRKKFMIFAPDQHRYLYPEFMHPRLWASRIDPDCPDLERFPNFARARGFVGELSPGDVLFIPKFWWHALSTTEASLNINRWIYSDREREEYWHQQPSARQFMDYEALLCQLERKFELMGSEGRDRARQKYQELRSGMLRLAAEAKGTAAARERP